MKVSRVTLCKYQPLISLVGSDMLLLYFIIIFYPLLRTFFIAFRERGDEKGREREKHRWERKSIDLHTWARVHKCMEQGLIPHLRHVP